MSSSGESSSAWDSSSGESSSGFESSSGIESSSSGESSSGFESSSGSSSCPENTCGEAKTILDRGCGCGSDVATESGVYFGNGQRNVALVGLPAGQFSGLFAGGTCSQAGGCGGGTFHTPLLCRKDCGLTVQAVFGATVLTFTDQGGSYVYADGAANEAQLVRLGPVFQLTRDGAVWQFHDFDQTAYPQGYFHQVTMPGGRVLAVTSYTQPAAQWEIEEIQATWQSGGTTCAESYFHTYLTSGENAGLLASLLVRSFDGAWKDLARLRFEYYGEADLHGPLGKLKRAVAERFDGADWAEVGLQYFRYYLDSAGGTGYAGAVKLALGREAYERLLADGLDPDLADDSALAPYADEAFEYDADGRVTRHVLDGGGREYALEYEDRTGCPGYVPGYNSWEVRTVETRADGSQNVYYSNYVGLLILHEFRAGPKRWLTYRRYDASAKLVMEAMPSAVDGYTFAQGSSSGSGECGELEVSLRPHAGVIRLYEYYGAGTSSSSGEGLWGPEGYKACDKVQCGQLGDEVLLRRYGYTEHTEGGVTIYPLATSIVYRNDDGTGDITTTYEYTFHPGTVQVQTQTTTLPVVPEEQNGDGLAHDTADVFDTEGRLVWRRGPCGAITHHAYDPATGARVQTIDDVDTARVDDEPSGWATVEGYGLHLVTDSEVDSQGRTVQVLGPLRPSPLPLGEGQGEGVFLPSPSGRGAGGEGRLVRRASWTIYRDDAQETWSASGYAVPETDGEGYDYAVVGPVSISRNPQNGQVVDQIAAVPPGIVGRLTGDESFPQSSWCRWTRSLYDAQDRLVATRVYHTIPSEGDGLSGVNYDETTYGYDALARQNRVTSPGGTITRTVFDARGRAVKTYVGTNDAGATDDDPTGGWLGQSGAMPQAAENNMTLVAEQQYDGGSDRGDGLLTRQTQHVSGDSFNSRATLFGYDCRNRLVTTDGELDYFAKNTYDNLDRVVTSEQYDTTDSGNLVARAETKYDEQGRVYQRVTYAVNPDTGEVTGHITSDTWYDASGRPIKDRPGGSEQFTKTRYDGLGRPVKTYIGFDVDESTYEDATTVDGDTVFEQAETHYDPAGNVIQTTSRQRFHNAVGTGELTTPGGLEPRARVSYNAAWYDGAGRQIASANYGTNGGEEFVRPAGVPERSDDVLVTSTLYNDRGEAFATIDPMGREDRVILDDAGRTIETVENYSPLPPGEGRVRAPFSPRLPGEGPGVRADQNKTTRMTYTPDGKLATLTAVNPTTGDQTTRYVYGSSLADSFVARSDLLRAEIYPDSDDTAHDDGDDAAYDRIEYTYNRQGEQKSRKDQNGTIRGFWYDKLGRLVHDYVDTLGQGVDGRVRRITRSYGVGSRLESITSYTKPCPRTGEVVDEVAMVYDAHGLLCAEFQSHSGPVDMLSTPMVEYRYDGTLESGELVKGLRPTKLIYPNGRIVRYEYGDGASSSSSSGASESDPDDCLNRVKFIADDAAGQVGTRLAECSYLGLGTIVTEDYPEPQVKLDYTPDGYSGFDRFGRVIDQRWQNYATGEDLDRHQYGYDRAGSRTYRRNATATERDESYLYDGLNRLVRADRGNLDPATNRIAGTPERQESWSLDPTGNWSRHVERESGTVTHDQERTHNRANELLSFSAAIGDLWSNPTHDRNGNMTRIPKPSNPSDFLTLRWDAWDRLVKVTDSVGVIAEYRYDGRNFRILSRTYRDPAAPESVLASPVSRQFYHNSNWQVLEERTGDSPTLSERQYVWSLRYIDAPVLRDRDTLADPTGLAERLYYLGDANFNITALITQDGTAAEHYTYTPYGNPSYFSPDRRQRVSSAFDNTILYTGRHDYAQTGLLFYRRRDYGPRLGRFDQRDPLAYSAGQTGLYEYVAGRPTNSRDASGLQCPTASSLWGGVTAQAEALRDKSPAAPAPAPEPSLSARNGVIWVIAGVSDVSRWLGGDNALEISMQGESDDNCHFKNGVRATWRQKYRALWMHSVADMPATLTNVASKKCACGYVECYDYTATGTWSARKGIPMTGIGLLYTLTSTLTLRLCADGSSTSNRSSTVVTTFGWSDKDFSARAW